MDNNKYKVENKSGQLLYLHLSDGSSVPLFKDRRTLVDANKMSAPVKALEARGDIKVTFLPAFTQLPAELKLKKIKAAQELRMKGGVITSPEKKTEGKGKKAAAKEGGKK